MVVVMSILIGLNWQRINGRRFIKLRELHVVVGCVEGRSTTAKDISKRFCVLPKNQNIRCLMKRKKRCWKVKQFLMVCKCLIEPYTVIGSKILQTMSRSRKKTPASTIACCKSQKKDKQMCNRLFRSKSKQYIRVGKEPPLQASWSDECLELCRWR